METKKRHFNWQNVFVLVLVLGTVGALVGPRIGQARQESKVSNLVDSLQMVRCRIEWYKFEHDGLLPGQKVAGGEISSAGFVADITSKSANECCPYIEEIPVNPFNDRNSVRVDRLGKGTTGGAGWFFDAETGVFCADDHDLHASY